MTSNGTSDRGTSNKRVIGKVLFSVTGHLHSQFFRRSFPSWRQDDFFDTFFFGVVFSFGVVFFTTVTFVSFIFMTKDCGDLLTIRKCTFFFRLRPRLKPSNQWDRDVLLWSSGRKRLSTLGAKLRTATPDAPRSAHVLPQSQRILGLQSHYR